MGKCPTTANRSLQPSSSSTKLISAIQGKLSNNKNNNNNPSTEHHHSKSKDSDQDKQIMGQAKQEQKQYLKKVVTALSHDSVTRFSLLLSFKNFCSQ